MRFLSIAFLLLLVFSAQAQIKLPPKQVEQKAPVKQTVTEVKPANTGPILTLKIISDINCKFYVDGEYTATIEAGDVAKINLKKGEYQFKSVSTENPDKVLRLIYPVEETGIEKFYNIEFNKTTAQTQSNVISEYGKDAQVLISWLGPGSVKLYFDKEEFFFTEGQKKALDLKPEVAYSLKAVKPDKTYSYNDFISFIKGKQGYTINLVNSALVIEKALTPAEIKAYFENRMVYVTGGTFNMGCSEAGGNVCDESDKPVHTQSVNNFYISKYEVTLKEFKLFIDDTGYKTTAERNGYSYVWNDKEWEKRPGVIWKYDMQGNLRPESDFNYPVTHIDQSDALVFCLWLQLKTGKKFRLPAEEEWEYAARGGNKSRNYKFSGSDDVNAVSWNFGNSELKTHPVGQKQSNELGLYDMNGNLWEITSSRYTADYSKKPVPTDSLIGIGMSFVSLNDSLFVTKTEKGGPAELAGIESGDKIILIDGENISGKPTSEIVTKIRGDRGTSVTVSLIKDRSKELLHITVQRNRVYIMNYLSRGGSFYNDPKHCTNASRGGRNGSSTNLDGFRIAHD